MLVVKLVATLTVLAANVVVYVCGLLLYQLVGCSQDCQDDCRTKDECQNPNIKYVLALLCTSVLCLLVLITASLDNVSWWSHSFPDAFMSTDKVDQFLYRLSVTEPASLVTIYQDFFISQNNSYIPKSRQKSVEMFKPKKWTDSTPLGSNQNSLANSVVKVRVEVSPNDKEAKEDMNKFIKEMVEQNSTPDPYDRRLLTGVSIEARLPQMALFQGRKIPQISVENKAEAVSLPLHSSFNKIMGDPVRVFVFSNNTICRNIFPALVSLKQVVFLLVMVFPVLGTSLSLLLADNTREMVVKKRYSRRKNLDEMLLEHPLTRQRLRLAPRLPQDTVSIETFGGLSPIGETDSDTRTGDSSLLLQVPNNPDSNPSPPSSCQSSTSSVATIEPLLPPPSYSALQLSDSPQVKTNNGSPPCYLDVMQCTDSEKLRLMLSKETDLI